MWWTPQIPMNMFHEEKYVAAWKVIQTADGSEPPDVWRVKELEEWEVEKRNDDKERRVVIPGISEQTRITARVAAKTSFAESEWSSEAECTTLATPNGLTGGFFGPLGPAGRGFKDGKYRWQQDPSNVRFQIAIPDSWKAKDISFKALFKELRIHYKPPSGGPEEELLVGPWGGKVLPDDVTWDIQTDCDAPHLQGLGRHISVDMKKNEKMEKWPSLLSGRAHPRIDVKMFALFGPDGGLTPGNLDLFD